MRGVIIWCIRQFRSMKSTRVPCLFLSAVAVSVSPLLQFTDSNSKIWVEAKDPVETPDGFTTPYYK